MNWPRGFAVASELSATHSTQTARGAESGTAWPWVSLIIRLVLAGVFLFAGLPKLGNLKLSQYATRAYEIFPYQVADVIGVVQPIVEVALGVLLLLGLFVRPMAILSSVMLVVFIAGIASAWARGLAIDCGCFSKGGAVDPSETAYPWEIARDVLFLILAGLLVWRPRSRFSLDGALWH